MKTYKRLAGPIQAHRLGYTELPEAFKQKIDVIREDAISYYSEVHRCQLEAHPGDYLILDELGKLYAYTEADFQSRFVDLEVMQERKRAATKEVIEQAMEEPQITE